MNRQLTYVVLGGSYTQKDMLTTDGNASSYVYV